MQKKLLAFFSLVPLIMLSLQPLFVERVSAATAGLKSCISHTNFVSAPPSEFISKPNNSFSFTLTGLSTNGTYEIRSQSVAAKGGSDPGVSGVVADGSGNAHFVINNKETFKNGKRLLILSGTDIPNCRLWDYNVDASLRCDGVLVWQENRNGNAQCFGGDGVGGDSCIERNDAKGTTSVWIQGIGCTKGGLPYKGDIIHKLGGPGIPEDKKTTDKSGNNGNTKPTEHQLPNKTGGYWVKIEDGDGRDFIKYNFSVKSDCGDRCVENKPTIREFTNEPFNLCKQISTSQVDALQACEDCRSDDGVWTAVGCIKHTSAGITKTLITIGLSAGGGISLLMILAAAAMFAVSGGDTKRTSEAKELLTAAIVGLLFIIFSITILQFIGVSILQIPGFGAS